MKTNRGLMSAAMAIAMLAMPVAASAHPINYHYRHGYFRNRIFAPAYNRMAPYRPRIAVPVPLTNAPWIANAAPMIPASGYYNYRPGYAMAPSDAMAPGYAMAPGDAMAPMIPAAPCAGSYMPNLIPPAYNYATPSYGVPMTGRLANMMRARDNADMMYTQALRNHNGVRAHHLANDIAQLNKNIANARMRGGLGPRYGNFNPMSGGYGNSYAYGNSNFGSLAPFLGNFIH